MEFWKDIPTYEGYYQASSLGRIRSLSRDTTRSNGRPFKITGRVLKPALNKDGYYKCALCVNKKLKSYRVHRLIAMAFHKSDYRQEGLEVNHIDGDKTNNELTNLELITHSENVQHSFDNGLQVSLKGSQVHNSKLKEEDIPKIRSMFANGFSSRAIAKIYQMDKTVFLDIKNGRLWKHV